MRIFLNEELEKINLDESLLVGVSWVGNQFQDVKIGIDWSGQANLQTEIDFINSNTSLYFEFVTDLELNLKFQPGTMGALEISSFTFELMNEIWSVAFTFRFYPVGYLKFKCNNLKFIVDDV